VIITMYFEIVPIHSLKRSANRWYVKAARMMGPASLPSALVVTGVPLDPTQLAETVDGPFAPGRETPPLSVDLGSGVLNPGLGTFTYAVFESWVVRPGGS
jgi:hypothetical protein